MNGVTVCTVKTNRQDWTLVGGRFLKVSTLKKKKIRGWVYQMPTKLEERKHCQQATACSSGPQAYHLGDVFAYGTDWLLWQHLRAESAQ